MSAATTYAPDRIGYRYGTPDRAYSKGYHRGQDVRKLNESGTASVVTDVEAIDDGVVVYVGRPNGLLAWTVVIDTGRARGRYESHSHMADISVGVGQRVSSGDRLGRNASMREDRGFIDGVHDHVTITDRLDGAWTTWLGEYDPLPYMQAAYERANQIRQSEEDDMDATQAAQLAQAATDISVVKQMLAETQQWKGVIATTSETNTTVGIIKQLLMETEQWTGIDTRVSQILAAVRDIAEAAASDAARDAALASVVQQIATSQGVDPAALTQIITDAAKAGAASALGQLNFPTAETIAQQVATQQDRVRLAALQAEVDRLTAELDAKRLFADNLAKPGS